LWEEPLTVSQAMRQAIQWLQEQHIPEAESSVPHLLAQALQLDYATGYRTVQTTLQNAVLSRDEWTVFQSYLQRRANHEPLQYIVGRWDFLDYTLAIRKPLLCPRPETEELVLLAEKDCPPHANILDVGCGTGAIGIALAHRLPHAHVTAIDVEPVAVQVSHDNALRILGDSQRYQAILCSAQELEATRKTFHIVVSNPPYIPETDLETIDKTVLDWESHEALFGGTDGMSVIREIIKQLPFWCHSGSICWMEVDPTHPRMIEKLLRNNTVVRYHSTHPDMFGKDRFIKLRIVK
jgi:release factor glutamine methyltransferase